MNLLVTGAGRPLADRLIAYLQEATEHRLNVRSLTDCLDARACEAALAGIDAVVHAANFDRSPEPSPADAGAALEQATLGSYHLADAARKCGVERIVVIGSLRIFRAYPEDMLIDEMWKPRPRPEPAELAPFLAEQGVREFAREGPICGICLRFLPIGEDPETQTRESDALHAVDCALALPFAPGGYRWHVFHIANSPRYLMRDAIRQLKFLPRERRNP